MQGNFKNVIFQHNVFITSKETSDYFSRIILESCFVAFNDEELFTVFLVRSIDNNNTESKFVKIFSIIQNQ